MQNLKNYNNEILADVSRNFVLVRSISQTTIMRPNPHLDPHYDYFIANSSRRSLRIRTCLRDNLVDFVAMGCCCVWADPVYLWSEKRLQRSTRYRRKEADLQYASLWKPVGQKTPARNVSRIQPNKLVTRLSRDSRVSRMRTSLITVPNKSVLLNVVVYCSF